MKTTIIGIIIIAILGTSLFFAAKEVIGLRKDLARVNDNVETLKSGQKNTVQKIDSFRFQTKALNVTVSELKENFPALVQQVKDEGIKAKNILSISNSILEYARQFTTRVRDTFMIVNGDTIHKECADFSDRYLEFHSCTYNGEMYNSIAVPDSNLVILSKKPRTLWQWLNGQPKQFYQKQIHSNKYVQPIYNEVINVVK